jgi:hypothetical protein
MEVGKVLVRRRISMLGMREVWIGKSVVLRKHNVKNKRRIDVRSVLELDSIYHTKRREAIGE